ncbi:GHKL domain-containing protein [Enterococcus sp. DIV0869a]|uniref:GHKL domain-containing protein n=2 Tax=Candidatus Enterococcus ikei TaxID=2815326 RepID=A0ABS3H0M1_9ENTE|nr:GHKL domain-containing protein [Enterococcus sp. DIV0869a]
MLMLLAVFIKRKKYIEIIGMMSYSLVILIMCNHCVTLVDMHVFEGTNLFSNNYFLIINQVIGCLFSTAVSLSVARLLVYANDRVTITAETKVLIYVIGIITSSILYVLLFFGIVPGNRIDLIGLNLFFLGIYLIVSLITFFMYISAIRDKYEMQQKEREYSENQRYMELMENQYKEMRKFRHDYKNILNSLEDFIVDEDYDGLKGYYFNKIKKTSHIIDQNDYKMDAIGNIKVREVKSIIASKLISAQEKEIDAQVEVNEIIDFLSIDSVILVRVLGIFLDNAIEELEYIGEGKLAVALYKDEHAVHIVIQNTCREDIPKFHILKKRGFSTKGDARGEGLSNVQDLIAPLENVRLATSINKNLFTQKLTIDNTERM